MAPMSEQWDAGELGCSRLIFELRKRVETLEPGAAIEVRAADEAAPIDIAAWCRVTGHALVSAEHPIYVIRRKT